MEKNRNSDERQLNVVVGVGAGIAAYKVAYVVRGLRERGHRVSVLPTEASLNFVGVQTWQELSEEPVSQRVFHGTGERSHIEIARNADLILVAPATADLLAKFATGLAGDLLTAVFLAADCPKILVPAMHTQMWLNAATGDNVAKLRERGIEVMEPASGALSSGDTGPGRLPEPTEILDFVDGLLEGSNRDLAGKRIVVTAGGTQEPLDPVRYLGNRSTGRQGIEIARAAARRGAEVVLICASVEVDLPVNPLIQNVSAATATEMLSALERYVPASEALFMVAAVADYRAETIASHKLRKKETGEALTLRLAQNPDLLKTVAGSSWRPPVLVGFAAETGSEAEILAAGTEKVHRKGADLIAINEVGTAKGFGDVDNRLLIVNSNGDLVADVAGTKAEVAEKLVQVALPPSLQ